KADKTHAVKIVEIRNASKKQMRHKSKYDISIADNHNYIAGGTGNGVIVHNSPIVTPGGHALKFAASIRIELRQIDRQISQDGEVIGIKVRAKIVKNKMAAPKPPIEFYVTYGKGVDLESDVVQVAIDMGVLEKAGAWLRLNGENVGNGFDKTVFAAKENPELLERISTEVYDRLRR
ncbi:MAG: hypothetical protein LC687_06200, partial [Actinobacteria bacterium]|nr:hypothetical protein [Actinomycetota bacterium]